jgi:hypothetical protein
MDERERDDRGERADEGGGALEDRRGEGDAVPDPEVPQAGEERDGQEQQPRQRPGEERDEDGEPREDQRRDHARLDVRARARERHAKCRRFAATPTTAPTAAARKSARRSSAGAAGADGGGGARAATIHAEIERATTRFARNATANAASK